MPTQVSLITTRKVEFTLQEIATAIGATAIALVSAETFDKNVQGQQRNELTLTGVRVELTTQ